MSIKDRINFWQQKKVAEQIKPFPKPVTFQTKKPLTTPPVISVRQPQQPLKIDVPEKSQLQEPKKQKEHKKVDQISPKQTQNIAYLLPIKQQLNQKIKRQEIPPQNQDKIISVKANINKFNNLSIPILGQNAQSCIVGSFKKRQAPKVQNEIKNESQTLLAQSMPLHQEQEKEQHQLTFKQKLLMAQKAFANRNGQFLLAKKVIEEPKQNKQVQEKENKTNSQQIVSTEVNCETNDKEKNENEQSDKLFQQSMKQQAQKQTLLVGGQTNNLTLQTRMTRRVKRKNDEDDFDDL